jgi:hypothetical protein
MGTAEKTDELFMAATLSDDDLGYPNEVEFVPGDEEWSDGVVWRNLTEGRPIVLVGEEGELLLIPRPRSPIDLLLGRVPVRVTQRVNGRPGPFVTASRLGRHPVRQMRELAAV